MDRYETTRYNRAPTISKPRTRFDLSHTILDTCNTGEFVPILMEPVFAGETWSCSAATLARLETSLHQTMDQAYCEIAFFFVPTEAVWDDYDAFFGANPDPWIRDTEVTIPQLDFQNEDLISTVVKPGSLLHHLGIPAGRYGDPDDSSPIPGGLSISLLPLRAVFKVWNDWYRDQNYDTEIAFATDSNDILAFDGGVFEFAFNGGYLQPSEGNLHVNRFHDLFSTLLPAPQKAVEVQLPLGLTAPIIADGDPTSLGGNMILSHLNGSGLEINKAYVSVENISGTNDSAVTAETSLAWDDTRKVTASNLKADLSQATAATVNQLRLAIAAQAIAERDARAGTRMKEHYLATWGVDTPDMELGRSEFLGGKRFPITMMEVLQTSETGTTVLGADAGHSKTLDTNSGGFLRSFKEDGFILGFVYFRTSRSYSQGIDRKFFLKNRLDMPDPMLDNIGEIPVFGKELKAFGAADLSYYNSPIGYQEPWFWLKEETNKIRGFYQPGVSGSMSSWHYGDDYSSFDPVVDAEWLKEGSENVDRTIAVESTAAIQWSFNIYLDLKATRAFSKYNIPNTFGMGR